MNIAQRIRDWRREIRIWCLTVQERELLATGHKDQARLADSLRIIEINSRSPGQIRRMAKKRELPE